MNISKCILRLLAAAALLCVSVQGHAGVGFCGPDSPSLSSTQTSANGLFTINIAAFAGGCPTGPSFLDGPLMSFSLPYFSDAHATISAPTGWTWQIIQGDLLNFSDPAPNAQVLVFNASSQATGIAARTTLSGFLITSSYSGVPTVVYLASTAGIAPIDYLVLSGSMPMIAGSPDAVHALDLPTSPVPEPSTWAMLALGLAALGGVLRPSTNIVSGRIPGVKALSNGS